MEDVGNNLKDKAKELLERIIRQTAVRISSRSERQVPARTVEQNLNPEQSTVKMRISGGKIKRIYNATKIQATVKAGCLDFYV